MAEKPNKTSASGQCGLRLGLISDALDAMRAPPRSRLRYSCSMSTISMGLARASKQTCITNNAGTTRELSTKIWSDIRGRCLHPRIQVVNQQRVWKSFPDVVEITPSGGVIYRQRIWGSFSQPLDLRNFPFDRQVFEIQLAAVGYTPEQVGFVVDPHSGISQRFSLPDWNIVDWKVESGSIQTSPDG